MENFDSTFDFWKILIIGLEQFGPFYGNTGAVMEFQDKLKLLLISFNSIDFPITNKSFKIDWQMGNFIKKFEIPFVSNNVLDCFIFRLKNSGFCIHKL